MINIARLLQEMPVGYEEACFETNAIRRKRGISDPGNLMLLSLFHLVNGCSLMEISAIAELTKLGRVSDVAFMKRFENCADWFKWINSQLVTDGAILYKKPAALEDYRVIAVDASDVTEKGRSGRIYRLHFALDLFSMESLQYNITSNKQGETLLNFSIQPKDLIVADRIYGSRNGIEHCLRNKGDFILRLKAGCFKLYDSSGDDIDLLNRLKDLKSDKQLDLKVFITGSDAAKIPLRICAMRKPHDAIEHTKKRLHRKESRKQCKIGGDTKIFNEYIVVATSLADNITAMQILETYRFRWQIEIYFKRLKSIMDFGEMPKRRADSVFAWLNGKLMVALIVEKMLGQSIFPPGDKLPAQHLA